MGLGLTVLIALAVYAADPAAETLGRGGGARFLGGGLAFLAAGASSFAAWRNTGKDRWAWAMISAALATRAVGFIVIGMEGAGTAVPFDTEFPAVNSNLLLVAGVATMATSGNRQGWRVTLGSIAIVLAVIAVAWDLLLAPAINGAGTETVGQVKAAAWGMSATLLTAALVVVIRDRKATSFRGTVGWIAAGALTVATADLVLFHLSMAANAGRPSAFELQIILGITVIAGVALLKPVRPNRTDEAAQPVFKGGEIARQVAPLASAAFLILYEILSPGVWSDGTFRVLAGVAILMTLAREAMILIENADFDRTLQESTNALRRRHSTVLSSSPDLVAVIRTDGTYEFANPAFERWLGLDPDQLTGRAAEEIVDRRDRYQFSSSILSISKPGGGDNGFAEAIRFTANDGTSRTFEVIASRLSDDSEGDGIVMVARDVSERIEATERLKDSETRMRTILAGAPDAILTIDKNGRVMDYNGAAALMFGGQEASAMRKQQLDEILRPTSGVADEIPSSLRNMGAPASRPVPCQGTRTDGTTFPAEASLTVIPDLDSQAMVVFVRDITQRMIAQSRSLESQKLEAIGQLAGGVAHDFNNLLTVIKGYSESVIDTLPEGSAVRGDIEEVRSAADRAAELTRHLLAFARRQNGEPGVVDPNGLIQGMGKMLGRLVRADILIEAKLDPNVSAVILDPGQFEQVIMNLVVNSRDAMPDGGRVLVETKTVKLTQRQSQSLDLPHGDYVSVIVRDEGSGMSDDVVAHIFEPFFTTKPPGVGTGLGLATCYGIVRQSGGAISVDSKPGQGTVFTILLPATDEAVVDIADSPDKDAAPGTETILLVEDERSVRAYGARVLTGLGYNVVQATDGVDALDKLDERGWRVDLVVSDIVMPRMSGKQLADKVKNQAPGLKMLFVSGYSPEVLSSRGSLPSDVPLVPKPFSADTLGSAVRSMLDGTPVEEMSLIGG